MSITWQKCRHPAPSLAVIKTFRRYGDYKLVLNPYHFQLIVALDLNTNLVPSTSVSQPVSTGILDFHFLRCDSKSDLVLLFSDSQLLRNHSSPYWSKFALYNERCINFKILKDSCLQFCQLQTGTLYHIWRAVGLVSKYSTCGIINPSVSMN